MIISSLFGWSFLVRRRNSSPAAHRAEDQDPASTNCRADAMLEAARNRRRRRSAPTASAVAGRRSPWPTRRARGAEREPDRARLTSWARRRDARSTDNMTGATFRVLEAQAETWERGRRSSHDIGERRRRVSTCILEQGISCETM